MFEAAILVKSVFDKEFTGSTKKGENLGITEMFTSPFERWVYEWVSHLAKAIRWHS